MNCRPRLVLFMVVLVCAACQKGAEQDSPPGQRGKKGAGRRNEGGAIPVRVVTAVSQPRARSIDTVAVLSGRRQVDVHTRAAGRVSFIGPPEGVRIREGEVLFRIDRSEPGESFLATPTLSPISGWVGRWLVSTLGEQVAAQEALVTIVDDEDLRAQVMLPSSEWIKVNHETPVRVISANEERLGAVHGVSRTADGATGRGVVTVIVTNAQHTWKAGMTAQIIFDLDLRERLVIPASALSITDVGSFVFLADNDTAVRTPVRFQMVNNDFVEILEGITGGTKVITEGVNQVGDASKIKVIDDPKGS